MLARGWLLMLAACGQPSEPAPDAATVYYGHQEALELPLPVRGQHFGNRVAFSGDGNTVAVNAIGSPDAMGKPRGGVYVFARDATGWTPQAFVQPSVIHAGDLFGSSIGLSALGDTLVVGAPGESSGATGVDGDPNDPHGALESGAAYVFKRNTFTTDDTTWVQQAYLKASNGGGAFGGVVAVASDSNTVAVGAVNETSKATGIDGDQTDRSLLHAGAAYVFTTNGMTWTQQAYLKASNTAAGQSFGNALAIAADGSTLAVAASGESSGATGIDGDQLDTTAIGAGATYVFHRADSTWTQQAYLKASNAGADDNFGAQLVLSGLGTTLVASAPFEDSDGVDPTADSVADSGAAYVFESDGAHWTQVALVKKLMPATSDQFGVVAISADGQMMAARAVADPSKPGAVVVYYQFDGSWQHLLDLQAPVPTRNDGFGTSIALSHDGAVIGVGAPLADTGDTDTGTTYVYH